MTKGDFGGRVLRWWEFICDICGESRFDGPTAPEAVRRVRADGWRCGICIADSQRKVTR